MNDTKTKKLKLSKWIEVYPHNQPINNYLQVTYPDGDIEFWTLDNSVEELERLQKLYKGKITTKIVRGY